MRAFIERIDIYPEKPKNGCWIRDIVFHIPMPVHGREMKTLPSESQSAVEMVCLLSKLNVKQHIEAELTMDEMDLTAAEKKASYEEIKE